MRAHLVILRVRTLNGDTPHSKVLYYISTMMAFRKNSRSVSDKDALQQRLSGVPPIIIDGLISRFTEKERSTNKYVLLPLVFAHFRLIGLDRPKMTPQTETMLLTHMFALCLRIDDYATDMDSVAHDLSMPPAK